MLTHHSLERVPPNKIVGKLYPLFLFLQRKRRREKCFEIHFTRIPSHLPSLYSWPDFCHFLSLFLFTAQQQRPSPRFSFPYPYPDFFFFFFALFNQHSNVWLFAQVAHKSLLTTFEQMEVLWTFDSIICWSPFFWAECWCKFADHVLFFWAECSLNLLTTYYLPWWRMLPWWRNCCPQKLADHVFLGWM